MKRWFESKAVWLGILTTTISILTFLQGEEWIQTYPMIIAGAGTAIGILQIFIRYITNTPMMLVENMKSKQKY